MFTEADYVTFSCTYFNVLFIGHDGLVSSRHRWLSCQSYNSFIIYDRHLLLLVSRHNVGHYVPEGFDQFNWISPVIRIAHYK